jgi:hypothetical protein
MRHGGDFGRVSRGTMRRVLLRTLSALSLIVGAALVVAFALGQWRADSLVSQRVRQGDNSWRAASVASSTSGIYVSWQRKGFSAPGEALAYERDLHLAVGFFHATTAPQRNPFAAGGSFLNRIGFGYEVLTLTRDGGRPGTYRGRWCRAHVPYWALAPAFLGAGLPAARASVARRRRLRRLAAGCCPSCGYDLRATPGRCPECGTATTRPA